MDESNFAFRLLLVGFLILVNGFFAGAEVALLAVRKTRLREMADEGVAGAQAAIQLLANPERLLSVVQVGVTLSSLGLGWAGEETFYSLFIGSFGPLTDPSWARLAHVLAFVLAFAAISYFHVIFGEVVPKNLAIEKADRLAALVAPPLTVFYRITLPFVVVIETSAAAISRLLQLKHGHSGGGHSAEELKLIVSSSRGIGVLPEQQEEMIHRVLDLGRISVREIMVSRKDIVSISAEADLDEVLRVMIEQQHSRLPVWEGKPEHIIGILHYKDLLPVWEERKTALRTGRPQHAFRVRRLLRPYPVVPETKPLAQTLEELRQGNSHMAMVVDEFGTIVGLITVEDVLEEIVGPIADEHDEKPPVAAAQAAELELDGATRLRDLETEYGIPIPTDGGFETLAGFLLFKLGKIPKSGESVEDGGRRYTVLAMDRNRIARVRIEKASAGAAAADGEASESRG